jgi:LTXXQ motif family protein
VRRSGKGHHRLADCFNRAGGTADARAARIARRVEERGRKGCRCVQGVLRRRISATLEAVRIVRPALEKFYNSLTDEQQARFNALGPNIGECSQRQPQQEANAQSDTCGEPKSSLTHLPIERIETVIRPAGTQKEALDRLRGATEKAIQGLQAACPDNVPLTPVGRLEAMEKRLEAMMQAANLVQPALDEFYATLSSEQKALQYAGTVRGPLIATYPGRVLAFIPGDKLDEKKGNASRDSQSTASTIEFTTGTVSSRLLRQTRK